MCFRFVRIKDDTSGIMSGHVGFLANLNVSIAWWPYQQAVGFAGHPFNPNWDRDVFGYFNDELIPLSNTNPNTIQ